MTNNRNKTPFAPLLLALSFVLFLGYWIVQALMPEPAWIQYAVIGLSTASFCGFIFASREHLKTRAGAFGVQSITLSVIVILLVGLVNFVAIRYPKKLDLTKNKVNTLSDQTVKAVKSIPSEMKWVVFAKPARKEELKTLIDNYKGLNAKISVDYVNPDHEINRVRQAGVKRDGTVLIQYKTRDSKIEEPSEEKLTNALIKILKEKNRTLCVTTGHGEKNFNSQEADGYSNVKKELAQQSYDVKEIILSSLDKIPSDCDAVAIPGLANAFLPKEVQLIADFLSNGGKAVVSLDFNLRTPEPSPELMGLLKNWQIDARTHLIVDPVAKMVNVEPVVSVISTFAKDHAITQDFQASAFLPFCRPLDILSVNHPSLKISSLAKTMPTSWAENDLSELRSGSVKFDAAKDLKGPHDVAVAIEGKLKDSKSERASRLVVFGTSAFATNAWTRFGGNLDLYLNAISWALEDESLISIRAKDEEVGRIEMTQGQSTVILILTVVVIPALTAFAGIVIWFRRKKL